MKPLLAEAFAEYVPAIDSYLKKLVFADAVIDRYAAPLNKAMHYSLDAGGKRLRPVLVILAYRLLADDWRRTLPVGGAYELVHTYSLIHDDLPAMDDDDLRRGQPTSHRVFGEALAILAGDGLLTEAFRLLAEEVRADPEIRLRLISGLARAAGAGGMVGGQAIDILPADRQAEATDDLLESLHRRKTGAMITGALLAGIDLAGGNPRLRRRLEDFGALIGLAFQVADDILDETGEEEKLGKDIGSDRNQGKLTFVSLYGLENARARLAELHRQALALLRPLGEKAAPLAALTDYIVERDR